MNKKCVRNDFPLRPHRDQRVPTVGTILCANPSAFSSCLNDRVRHGCAKDLVGRFLHASALHSLATEAYQDTPLGKIRSVAGCKLSHSDGKRQRPQLSVLHGVRLNLSRLACSKGLLAVATIWSTVDRNECCTQSLLTDLGP